MRELGKLVAHIPARGGSKRVVSKNLRMLGDKPLLAYSVKCALDTNLFSEIYVNSDSDTLLALAQNLGVSSYKRPPQFATDEATGDQFTEDFLKNVHVNTLVMINPVCPLIEPSDVIAAIEAFKHSDCDTLISCDSTRMQTFCRGKPINISVDEQLVPTQRNPSVETLNWAVTVWDVKQYLLNIQQTGSAYIGKNRLLFPLEPLKSIKISNEEDFILTENIILGMKKKEQKLANYWTSDS